MPDSEPEIVVVDGRPWKPHGAAVHMFGLLLDSITLEERSPDMCVSLENRATEVWAASPEWLRADIHRVAERLLTYGKEWES